MDIWFTADTHFGHHNIIRFCDRPFKGVKDMDECLVQNWNEQVKPGDLVYHLGDFSFHRPKETGEILDKLHGDIVLVEGNHDRRTVSQLRTKFEYVTRLCEIEAGFKKFVLCHYPLLSWKGSYRGSYHLHGHCHGNLKEEHPQRMDVGVDSSFYTPWHVDSVIFELESRNGSSSSE